MFTVIKFVAMVKSKISDVDLTFCVLIMIFFTVEFFAFIILACCKDGCEKQVFNGILMLHFLEYIAFVGMLVCNFFETSMEKSFGLKKKNIILALFEPLGFIFFLFSMYTFFAMCHSEIKPKDFLRHFAD